MRERKSDGDVCYGVFHMYIGQGSVQVSPVTSSGVLNATHAWQALQA